MTLRLNPADLSQTLRDLPATAPTPPVGNIEAKVNSWRSAIRVQSNEIEAALPSKTDQQILDFDARDDAHWA